MPEQIVCANCGIRYSTELVECPWCGTAHRPPPAAPVAPASEHAGPATSDDGAGPPEEPDPAAAQDLVAQSGEPPDAPDPAAAQAPESDGPPEEPDPAATRPATAAAPDGGPPEPELSPDPVEAPPPPPGPETVVAVPAPPAETASAPPPAVPPPVPAPPSPDPAGAPATNGAAPATPARRPRWPRVARYLVVIVLLLILGAALAEFVPLGPRSGTPAEPTPVEPLGVDQTPVIDTTIPPPPPTTTAATTAATTTPPPTATTVPPTTSPPPTVPPVEPIGDPIPLGDLAMGADGLGVLEFGDDGRDVVGRLAATFGQPDADTGVTISTGEFGACVDDTVRVVRFGSLAAVNAVDGSGAELFAGYRVDLDYQPESSPADALATISGLSAGDSVGDLQRIYANFDVRLSQGGGGAWFELRASSGVLLLEGPITAVDPGGEVRGIYSRPACPE